MKRYIVALIFILSLAACSVQQAPKSKLTLPEVKARWFAFLQNGVTSKEEVLKALGAPSGAFEEGRVLTYRIWVVPEKGLYVLPTGLFFIPSQPSPRVYHTGVQLITIFDNENILKEHIFLGHTRS